MTKKMTILILTNISKYISDEKAKAQENGQSFKFDCFPTSISYAIYKNFKEIDRAVQDFTDFRNKAVEKLRNEYFGNDEKSEIFTNDDGNQDRRIKAEYIQEFKDDVEKLNKELVALSSEEVELEFRPIDIDNALSRLPDTVHMTDLDFSILEMFVE